MTEQREKEIDTIVALINRAWKTFPNMRLCQLIGNCFPAGDLYYTVDDVLEMQLRGNYFVTMEGDK